jgi:hypothetical protein
MAAPMDERVETMLAFIERVRADAQLGALSADKNPDQRAVSLGSYYAILQLKAKFIELFGTVITPTVPAEPDELKGDVINGEAIE